MSGPVYFCVLRGKGGVGESPALYFDHLPEAFSRRLPRDDKGQPIEEPALIWGVRLDRLPEDHEWRRLPVTAPLLEWLALYQSSVTLGTLPPSNMADPPREGGQKGIEAGQWRFTPAQPWHGKPADPFPHPDALQPKPSRQLPPLDDSEAR